MVKSKAIDLSISPSTIFFHSFTNKSLQEFPTELLILTFNEFDIPTLLNVCNVCKRFQQIGSKVLSKKFERPEVGIMLTFEQEYKWRFHVPFEFSKYNEQNGKFIFKPRSKQAMRFIHSSMIRSPVLSKISIIGVTTSNEIKVDNNNEIQINSTTTNLNNNNNHTLTDSSSSSNSLNPLNPLIKIKKLEENYLQKSLTLNIKSHKETLNKVQYVYRIGHGTTHLRIPYRFKYSIVDTPPPSAQKTRGGERWVTPISFECSPSFFYPNISTAHKLIMTIIHLRKKNLQKKKSPYSSQSSNYKQKQKAVDLDEIDENITYEYENDDQRYSQRQRHLLERKMNQALSAKGILKNKYGARS